MRTKISIYIALIGSVLATSCAKFLEQDMRSSIEAEEVFDSAANALLYVNGVYGAMHTSSDWGIYDANVIVADIGSYAITTSQSASRYNDFDGYSLTYSNSTIEALYDESYAVIQKANYAIQGVENMTTLEASLQNRFVAECRFIRALMHFNLVRYFGGVTVKMSLTEGEDMDNGGYARNTIQEVYRAIIEDLEYCEEHLWYKSTSSLEPCYGATDVGRVTRCAALGLLAKVYLTAASYAKHSSYAEAWNTLQSINDYSWVDIADYYTRSVAVAERLISLSESGQVDVNLDADYGYIFTHSGENSSESLFEIQNSSESSMGSRFGCWIALQGLPYTYTLRIKATPELFYLYERKYDTVAGEIDYENTDLRGLWNMPMVKYDSGSMVDMTSLSYISIFKYRYGALYTSSDNCPVNFPVLRYADVVLGYAEALNELGRVDEARGYLNRVRARARQGITFYDNIGVPFEFSYTGTSSVPADYNSMGQADLREAIIKERKLELSGEGHDRFDAARMGRLISEAQQLYNYGSYPTSGANFFETVEKNGGVPPETTGRRISDTNLSEKYLFLPIPKSEIDRVSSNVLVQNAGWGS
ncbi:MAG: RagB/SusD family nutrient uptake outer membrane protein [Rikenellaceae bacterium]